jgi:hypothetical protein
MRYYYFIDGERKKERCGHFVVSIIMSIYHLIEAVVKPSFKEQRVAFRQRHQTWFLNRVLLQDTSASAENNTIIALGNIDAEAITYTAGRLYSISKSICCGDICT